MTMEDRRRDIEAGITPDADDLLRRIEATVGGKIATMRCGDLLDRMLDLRDVATDFPQTGVISMRLKQEFQRAGKRLNFAAKEADCLSQPEYNQLNRTVDLLSSTLGEDEVFDVAQRYERQARNAFEGSVAGRGPG